MTVLLGDIIERRAHEESLNPDLVAAIVYCESKGNVSAVRYEPKFFAKYLAGTKKEDMPGYWPPRELCSSSTEKMFRAVSWGLMQVMGETAREEGFSGNYMTELLDPDVNVKYGIKVLSRCLNTAKFKIEKALLLYNGGGDKGYPDRVLSSMGEHSAKILMMGV